MWENCKLVNYWKLSSSISFCNLNLHYSGFFQYNDFNEFIPLFTSQHSYLRPVNTTRTGRSVMPPLPELCPASHFWRLPSQFACSKISGFSVIGKSKFLSRERYLIISSFSLLALARKLQQRIFCVIYLTTNPMLVSVRWQYIRTDKDIISSYYVLLEVWMTGFAVELW